MATVVGGCELTMCFMYGSNLGLLDKPHVSLGYNEYTFKIDEIDEYGESLYPDLSCIK